MIVVADTSPLRYLILIEHAHVLPLLYGRVIIPPAVLAELDQEHTPESVRSWLSNKPDWLQVQMPKTTATADELALGLGERAAIALAVELSALAHDARLYGVFKEEARQIEREGGRATRVVLDYELKREYQQFLHREDRPADADMAHDRLAFAEAHGLTVVDGHLELPDLRIEYETEDGRLA